MFNESNNNWQTGESNSFENIINATLVFVFLLGIFLIFYTPSESSVSNSTTVKDKKSINTVKKYSDPVQDSEMVIQNNNQNTINQERNKDIFYQSNNSDNLKKKDDIDTKKALKELKKKEKAELKKELKAQKKAEKLKKKEEKKKKSKLKADNIEKINFE